MQAQVTSSEQGSGKGAFAVRLEGPANLWGTCLILAHLLLAYIMQYRLCHFGLVRVFVTLLYHLLSHHLGVVGGLVLGP